MERNNFLQEFAIAAGLLIILGLFLNPFDLYMSDKTSMTVLGIFLILYLLFVVYLWRERARDEREAFHALRTGRLSFFVGSAVLTLGIAYQMFTIHMVEPWLVYTLGAMVLAKVAGSIWNTKQH